MKYVGVGSNCGRQGGLGFKYPGGVLGYTMAAGVGAGSLFVVEAWACDSQAIRSMCFDSLCLRSSLLICWTVYPLCCRVLHGLGYQRHGPPLGPADVMLQPSGQMWENVDGAPRIWRYRSYWAPGQDIVWCWLHSESNAGLQQIGCWWWIR